MNDMKEYLDHLLKVSTPDRPAWNKEALMESHQPKWNYIDGCMIKAVLEMYFITKNEEYLKFADDFIDYYIDEDGNILNYEIEDYNCDNINEGKVLFTLYEITGKAKYRKALDLLYSQVCQHPRTEGGNFWHKKIYPYQIWLDGLYMVQPFYMEYETAFNNNKNYPDIFKQFENVVKLIRDPETGLYFHGYDESKESFWCDKETGLSKHFWSRSLGWFSMAIVDTIERMDQSYREGYEALCSCLKDLLDALLKVADPETKMLYQVPDQGGREGNYLETSGTCAMAYTLMKAARLGYIPADYFEKGEEIFRSVVDHKLVRKEGTFVLKDVCLVAGLGGMPGKGDYKLRDGSYEYYISEPIVDDDAKGVAPFLLAFTEVYRKGE